MFKISRRSLVAGIAAVAVAPKFALAQQGPSSLLAQIPGLESAYARRYNPGHDAHGIEPEIEATEATPTYMLIMGLIFESEEILKFIANNILSPELAATVIGTSEELSESTVEDLEGFRLFATGEDAEEYSSLLVVSKENVAFLVNTRGDSDAVQETANAAARFMLEAELSEAPVNIISEGVAEGGVFDSFPGEDDLELLNGTVPRFDYDLMVSDSPIGSEES